LTQPPTLARAAVEPETTLCPYDALHLQVIRHSPAAFCQYWGSTHSPREGD
jgi:hypothetical protein